MAQQPATGSGLFLNGTRETGEDVRNGNVMAALAVSHIVKSSLGPVGLDKMLVDDIGDVTITNDGATILSRLEVEHPAARVLVDLARLQDREVGDGTTSVVVLAAELLRRANVLATRQGLHPTTILSGYRMALKESIYYLKRNLIVDVSRLDSAHLRNAARTSMSSKIIGKESDFFADLAVRAVQSVKMRSRAPPTRKGGAKSKYKYPLSAIHILKSHGRSSTESYLVDGGFALNATRAAQGMVTSIEKGGHRRNQDNNNNHDGNDEAKPDQHDDDDDLDDDDDDDLDDDDDDDDSRYVKIALLDMQLQRHRMAMGVQVLVEDPSEIEKIQRREMDILRERLDEIVRRAGANVILTTKGVDDHALKYMVEAGVMCARRCDKDDLKRLAKATGGRVVTTMADMDGDESFDPDNLGYCRSFREVRIGDGEMLYAHGCAGRKRRRQRRRRKQKQKQQGTDANGGGGEDDDDDAILENNNDEDDDDDEDGGAGVAGASTIVLRGANDYMLDEMDRALHDALCVVKRMLESSALVAGGGAVEAALSIHLEDHAASRIATREQLAVHEFAQSLLVIPKTLAVNAASNDSSDLVAKLRSVHARGQRQQPQPQPGGEAEGGGGETQKEGTASSSSSSEEAEEKTAAHNEDEYDGDPSSRWKHYGLDLFEGTVRDNLKAGVVEPAISKIKSLRFATEAAITILRIDDRITLNPDEGGAGGGRGR